MRHYLEWEREVPVLLDDASMEVNDARKRRHRRLRPALDIRVRVRR
jgi:hypothetical protein